MDRKFFFVCVAQPAKEARRPSWHISEGFESISERREACVPHQDRRIRLMLLASGIPSSPGCPSRPSRVTATDGQFLFFSCVCVCVKPLTFSIAFHLREKLVVVVEKIIFHHTLCHHRDVRPLFRPLAGNTFVATGPLRRRFVFVLRFSCCFLFSFFFFFCFFKNLL